LAGCELANYALQWRFRTWMQPAGRLRLLFFEIIYKKYNNFDEHQNFHASKVVPSDKWTIDVIN
jgi:hypothetical protein